MKLPALIFHSIAATPKTKFSRLHLLDSVNDALQKCHKCPRQRAWFDLLTKKRSDADGGDQFDTLVVLESLATRTIQDLRDVDLEVLQTETSKRSEISALSTLVGLASVFRLDIGNLSSMFSPRCFDGRLVGSLLEYHGQRNLDDCGISTCFRIAASRLVHSRDPPRAAAMLLHFLFVGLMGSEKDAFAAVKRLRSVDQQLLQAIRRTTPLLSSVQQLSEFAFCVVAICDEGMISSEVQITVGQFSDASFALLEDISVSSRIRKNVAEKNSRFVGMSLSHLLKYPQKYIVDSKLLAIAQFISTSCNLKNCLFSGAVAFDPTPISCAIVATLRAPTRMREHSAFFCRNVDHCRKTLDVFRKERAPQNCIPFVVSLLACHRLFPGEEQSGVFHLVSQEVASFITELDSSAKLSEEVVKESIKLCTPCSHFWASIDSHAVVVVLSKMIFRIIGQSQVPEWLSPTMLAQTFIPHSKVIDINRILELIAQVERSASNDEPPLNVFQDRLHTIHLVKRHLEDYPSILFDHLQDVASVLNARLASDDPTHEEEYLRKDCSDMFMRNRDITSVLRVMILCVTDDSSRQLQHATRNALQEVLRLIQSAFFPSHSGESLKSDPGRNPPVVPLPYEIPFGTNAGLFKIFIAIAFLNLQSCPELDAVRRNLGAALVDIADRASANEAQLLLDVAQRCAIIATAATKAKYSTVRGVPLSILHDQLRICVRILSAVATSAITHIDPGTGGQQAEKKRPGGVLSRGFLTSYISFAAPLIFLLDSGTGDSCDRTVGQLARVCRAVGGESCVGTKTLLNASASLAVGSAAPLLPHGVGGGDAMWLASSAIRDDVAVGIRGLYSSILSCSETSSPPTSAFDDTAGWDSPAADRGCDAVDGDSHSVAEASVADSATEEPNTTMRLAPSHVATIVAQLSHF